MVLARAHARYVPKVLPKLSRKYLFARRSIPGYPFSILGWRYTSYAHSINGHTGSFEPLRTRLLDKQKFLTCSRFGLDLRQSLPDGRYQRDCWYIAGNALRTGRREGRSSVSVLYVRVREHTHRLDSNTLTIVEHFAGNEILAPLFKVFSFSFLLTQSFADLDFSFEKPLSVTDITFWSPIVNMDFHRLDGADTRKGHTCFILSK